jgi:hypothetical protein
MEQLKNIYYQLSKNNHQQINQGNVIALTLLGIAMLQFISTSIPIYIYVVELAFPAFMTAYHISKKIYFVLWKDWQNQIAELLGMSNHDYREKAFASQERMNYFEILLLKTEGRNLDLFKEIRGENIVGRTWSEARDLAEGAKQRLKATRRIFNKAGRTVLQSEEALYIRNKLAEGDFNAAQKAISDAAQRNEEKRVEAEKIFDKARKANCLAVILRHFKNCKFEPEEARRIIISALSIRHKAWKLGIEKSVIAELEAGDLEEARSLVAEAREAERQLNRKKPYRR